MEKRSKNIPDLRVFLGKYSIYVIMVVLFFGSALLNENFLSVANLTNIGSIINLVGFSQPQGS
jgi:ribose/xylose/arabinose/galactoside ABC-type transport system permease subunit